MSNSRCASSGTAVITFIRRRESSSLIQLFLLGEALAFRLRLNIRGTSLSHI
jgi:hypothetical protein